MGSPSLAGRAPGFPSLAFRASLWSPPFPLASRAARRPTGGSRPRLGRPSRLVARRRPLFRSASAPLGAPFVCLYRPFALVLGGFFHALFGRVVAAAPPKMLLGLYLCGLPPFFICLAAACSRPAGSAPTYAASSGALPRRAPSMGSGGPASPPRLPRSLRSRPRSWPRASGERWAGYARAFLSADASHLDTAACGCRKAPAASSGGQAFTNPMPWRVRRCRRRGAYRRGHASAAGDSAGIRLTGAGRSALLSASGTLLVGAYRPAGWHLPAGSLQPPRLHAARLVLGLRGRERHRWRFPRPSTPVSKPCRMSLPAPCGCLPNPPDRG